MKALVIFSGGQDSTTCLGWALNRYDEVETVTFKYGQKHSNEIDHSKNITEKLNIKQKIIDVSFFGRIVDSALTHDGDVNKPHQKNKNLPSSFVPNRNAFFITTAHAYAQKIEADILITGVGQEDYSGYPDCRQVFIDKIADALNTGSETDIIIKTPLMDLKKWEIFKLAEKENILDIVLKYSLTCYNGIEKMNEWGYGCGNCPACKLRKNGWKQYKQRRK